MLRLVPKSKPRDHMARVACTDEVWTEFKRLAQIDDWQPVNEYLGELVVREVARQQRLRVRGEEATARDVLAALDQVKLLRDDLEGIAARLEALAGKPATPAAAATGSAWDRPPTPEERAEWMRREAERLAAGDVWRPPADQADAPDWEP
jgi:hypothetical protein